jgi:hypothetical protein
VSFQPIYGALDIVSIVLERLPGLFRCVSLVTEDVIYLTKFLLEQVLLRFVRER